VVQAICFKMPVKSFKKLFGKKSVFPQFILQAICFKMPVKSLNSSQTYFRHKKAYSSMLCRPAGKKSLCLHAMLCFKMPVKCSYSCQTIVRQKGVFFHLIAPGNMLQKACGKFEFLSNNCSSKKAYFSIKFEFLSNNCLSKKRIVQAICFKKPVKSLNSCQTIVRQKTLIFHTIVKPISLEMPVRSLNSCQTIVWQKSVFLQVIVQAICFKMPVKSLDSGQTIVRQKTGISPCTGNKPQNACEKFKLLSNNCLTKKVFFSMLLRRQFASKCL
jgi:hypothetical protein